MNAYQNKLTLSPARERVIICIILGIFPLLGMAVDLIAPSLPAISQHLHISETVSKNLIAIYLLGYALGNFFTGFLSDALGRRKLAIPGFIVFIAASLLPAVFPGEITLLTGRFLQGLSLGSTILLRAILSDILPAEKLLRIATLMAATWGIGPIIGPVIGAYLQYYIGWQACFYFFALYGLVCLIALITLIPETHHQRQPLNIPQIKSNFRMIIAHPLFIGMTVLMGISYSSLIVFHTLAPFLVQVTMGHSPIYFGHLALWMGVVFLLGTMICRALVKQFEPEKILSFAIPFFLIATIGGLIFAYAEPQSIWGVIISSFCMFLACGIIYPSGMGRGLALFRHLAGSSAAVMNLVNVLITSFVALMMSFITAGSALTLTGIYLILMILSGSVFWLFIGGKSGYLMKP
jgi:DHA1 family bicyclomycin/chloramphenicol resistance-like MFS transporter